jgi:hypothetical protein
MKLRTASIATSLFIASAFFVACGSDDGSNSASSGDGTCPSKLTIQTDWFHEL